MHKKGHREKRGKKGGTSAIAAGAAGAVMGAALGATATALANKNVRRKIGERVDDLREMAADAIDTIQDKSEDVQQAARNIGAKAGKSIKFKRTTAKKK